MSWWSDWWSGPQFLGDGESPEEHRQAVKEDLLTFEEENDMLLPNGMTPEEIAELEMQGYVVNLLTGEIIPEEEADDYGVPNV